MNTLVDYARAELPHGTTVIWNDGPDDDDLDLSEYTVVAHLNDTRTGFHLFRMLRTTLPTARIGGVFVRPHDEDGPSVGVVAAFLDSIFVAAAVARAMTRSDAVSVHIVDRAGKSRAASQRAA